MSATADARASPLCRAPAKLATAWHMGKSSRSATAATTGTTTGSRQSRASRASLHLQLKLISLWSVAPKKILKSYEGR